MSNLSTDSVKVQASLLVKSYRRRNTKKISPFGLPTGKLHGDTQTVCITFVANRPLSGKNYTMLGHRRCEQSKHGNPRAQLLLHSQMPTADSTLVQPTTLKPADRLTHRAKQALPPHQLSTPNTAVSAAVHADAPNGQARHHQIQWYLRPCE